jgi:hypothetical protein
MLATESGRIRKDEGERDDKTNDGWGRSQLEANERYQWGQHGLGREDERHQAAKQPELQVFAWVLLQLITSMMLFNSGHQVIDGSYTYA